ncbi:chain length determinant protein [Sabulibacter ruber]|uniref:chain length determinant protein n=1 Tax=Sabulibacter ruber TaxID=2811901 RepID=UPI001A971829|nr:chain length determinant protein [Sabulibacter ruber]
MDKPTLREERTTDEIDLRVVFRKLVSFGKKIQLKFIRTFFLLLRRWPVVLGVTLLGIGLGYLMFETTRPFYRSSLTLAPAEIRNTFFEGQVTRLSNLVMDGNREMVAADLKISPENAGKIKSIKYANIDETLIAEDSLLVGAPFRIDVELYDSKFFAPFQAALIEYFERNTFFTRNTQARREQLQSLIDKLKLDIASIDSIKRSAVALRGPANGFVYGEPLDPTNLYRQSAELFEKQAHLEAQLRRLETVQVVVGFAPLLHPTGPKVKVYLLVGAILGFFLSYLLVLRLEHQRKKRISAIREL